MTKTWKEEIADFWAHFIDPFGTEVNKFPAFSKGWKQGARDAPQGIATFHTWQGVGYQFGLYFGAVDLEEKRQAWNWAKDRLHKYGWVEVKCYEGFA